MRQLLSTIYIRIKPILGEEEGQGLAEYALILGSIAAIAVLALVFIGSDITSLLSKVAEDL
jgi:Flp pilus assembly pilin Flp